MGDVVEAKVRLLEDVGLCRQADEFARLASSLQTELALPTDDWGSTR